MDLKNICLFVNFRVYIKKQTFSESFLSIVLNENKNGIDTSLPNALVSERCDTIDGNGENLERLLTISGVNIESKQPRNFEVSLLGSW